MGEVAIEPVTSVGNQGFVDLLGSFLRESPSQGTLKAIEDAMEADQIAFYLARLDGAAIGLCSVTWGFTTYRAAPFALTDDLFVATEARGQGVGKALVEQVCVDAAARGCRTIVLGCDAELEAMYRGLGFKALGTMMARDLP